VTPFKRESATRLWGSAVRVRVEKAKALRHTAARSPLAADLGCSPDCRFSSFFLWEQVIEIEALAREYAPQIKTATTGKSDSARVAASIAILDRAFGRPRRTFRRKGSQTSNTGSQTSRSRWRSGRRNFAPEIEVAFGAIADSRRESFGRT
jgi:hypothetical protein